MTELGGAVRGPFLSWPGRIESAGTVKRRLLLVASIMAIAVAGVYEVSSMGPSSPWTDQEERDMAGLPNPPAPFTPTESGDIRQLSPAEYAQLQEIKQLIERFPVPDEFVNIRPEGGGRNRGGGGGG
jgi:hypothetical protein